MKLQIKDDAGRVTVVSIANKNEISIGRKEGNTLRLTERNVSRSHARLVKSGDEVTVEDLSRYGTRVNGQRIRGSRKVGTGDIIQIGDYELSLDGARQVDPPVAPAARVPEVKAPPTEADRKRQKEIEAAARAQIAAAKAEALGGRREATTSLHAIDDADDGERKSLGAGKKRIVGALPSLVVVSDELAGKTWTLAEGTTVLGRAGECGIVIDHHSVSGNHARVTVADGQAKVFDLKSKNGLRINGENWEESALKAGDIIELGKVRLRFVGAGEEFVYRAEDWRGGAKPAVGVASEGPEPAPTRKGFPVWVVIAAVVVAGGLTAWFLTRPKTVSNTAGPAVVTAATPTASAPPSAPATPAEPTPAAASAGSGAGDAAAAIAEALTKAKADIAAQRWDEALKQLEVVTALDKAHVEGLELKAAATREREIGVTLERAVKAKGEEDLSSAWFTLTELGPVAGTSHYAARVTALMAELKPEAIVSHLTEAKSFFDGKSYAEAIQKAEQVLALEPGHAEATELVAKAKAKADKAKDPDKAKEKDRDKPNADGRSADEIYAEAKSFHNAEPAKALTLYQQAASKGKVTAWRQIGSLRARTGDRAGAIKAYEIYLKQAPDASDAQTVRDVLKQWQGQ